MLCFNIQEINRMEVVSTKTDKEIYQSLLAEIAKSTNELRCLRKDAEKINSRLSFLTVLANELISREK